MSSLSAIVKSALQKQGTVSADGERDGNRSLVNGVLGPGGLGRASGMLESSNSPAMQREDTVALKLELANASGERGPEYWRKFREYLSGKATMKDFNETAESVLGKEYAGLHNRLVLAILSNVHRNIPPPPGPRHLEFIPGKGRATLKRAREEAPNMAEKRRQYRFGQIQTLDKADRTHILSLQNEQRASDEATPAVPAFPEGISKELEDKVAASQSCRQTGGLLSREALRARMEVIAELNGITLDGECVSFMEQALAVN
ncbi:hypothetical protein HK101_004607 [Irineochytrium annulatum]|nr:hypothetical protein HK101_004607 [Irineochytrium annulatum]